MDTANPKTADPIGSKSKNLTNDHASFEDVKRDLADLKNDVAGLVSSMAQSGKQTAQHGLEAVGDFAKNTKDTAQQAGEKVHEHVRDHPLTSLAIAFGLGAIISRILR